MCTSKCNEITTNLVHINKIDMNTRSYCAPTFGEKSAGFFLDKTETPSQKKNEKQAKKGGSTFDKNSFLNSYYKNHNNSLVFGLLNSQYKYNPTIQKTTKRLSFCSHLAKVEMLDNKFFRPGETEYNVLGTSKKCRDKNCPRCNSIKASKYKARFLRCLSDEKMNCFFRNKYFYFLTFTVKHNTKETRNYVYFNEFKKYVEQLRESTLFNKYFPMRYKFPRLEIDFDRYGRGASTEILIKQGIWRNAPKEQKREYLFPPYSQSKQLQPKAPAENKDKSCFSGYAQSYEVTFTKNGFHIHSHLLMCAPRLRDRAKDVQKQLQDKWFSITGDSDQVRLDLVKVDEHFKAQVQQGHIPEKLSGFVSECFKYTIKAGNVFSTNDGQIEGIEGVSNKFDLIAKWLIDTKGKKMITSNGFFKELGLFAQKSIWDIENLTEEEIEEKEALKKHHRVNRYFVGRTSDIKFNHSAKKTYSKRMKKKILEDIHIIELGETFKEITYWGSDFDLVLHQFFSEENENDCFSVIDAFLESGELTQDAINRIEFERGIIDCFVKKIEFIIPCKT